MKEGSKESMLFQGRKVLVVEDDKTELANAVAIISELGAVPRAASSLDEARKALAEGAFDYLLTDLHISTRAGLDPPDGMQVIKSAVETQPNITIVANSSDPRADIWSLVLKAGAHHFIRKPLLNADELVIAFSLARERKRHVPVFTGINPPPQGLWRKYAGHFPEQVVIDSKTLKQARGLARHPTASMVIYGETGTGKEVLARLMHKFRCEREGEHIPFIAVNCATITSGLAESILFGHQRGAFTGADKTTDGYIAKADGGILFLDEIHTLEMSVQQKLLRVLNDGSYQRLGEVKEYKSRFQLIAASTKNLDKEVEKNKFLIDLRSRMMGMDFFLNPLRERPQDIAPLVALFLTEKCVSLDDSAFQKLCQKLEGFYWQGNIRQLFKSLESWLILSEIEEIPLDADHFPVFRGMLEPEFEEWSADVEGQKRFTNSEDFNLTADQDGDLMEAVARFERAMVVNAMHRHPNASVASRAMNMARTTFDMKRRKYGLHV